MKKQREKQQNKNKQKTKYQHNKKSQKKIKHNKTKRCICRAELAELLQSLGHPCKPEDVDS